MKKYQQLIKNPHIKITKYSGYSLPLDLKCELCGNSFKKEARLISRNHNLECPYCQKNKKDRNIGYQIKKKDDTTKGRINIRGTTFLYNISYTLKSLTRLTV